jgi:lysophospholipase L1-like esterase
MLRREFIQSTFGVAGFVLVGLESIENAERPFIINAGVGGNNTADLLARIEKDCLAYKPDMTILMVGTNDMNSQKYVPLPEYEKNLRNIVGQILNIKSQVLLMTILPVYEPYLFTRHQRSFYGEEGHRGRKEKMNAVIKKVATEYKLHFLDMHHIFEKIGNVGEESSSLIKNMANSNKTDGLHPTNDGYRTMAVAIYEKLKSIDAGFTRLVCFGDSITNGGGGVDGTSYPAYLKKLLGY